MPVSYQELKGERQWRSTTGTTEEQFKGLLTSFSSSYERLHGKSMSERKGDSSQESIFQTYEDLLFFVLFSLKSGLTYDILGFVFGCSAATVQRNQREGLQLLQLALSDAGAMPARSFQGVKDFEAWFSKAGDEVLIVDGTEQRTQRPKDCEEQKEAYSGKKNPIP